MPKERPHPARQEVPFVHATAWQHREAGTSASSLGRFAAAQRPRVRDIHERISASMHLCSWEGVRTRIRLVVLTHRAGLGNVSNAMAPIRCGLEPLLFLEATG